MQASTLTVALSRCDARQSNDLLTSRQIHVRPPHCPHAKVFDPTRPSSRILRQHCLARRPAAADELGACARVDRRSADRRSSRAPGQRAPQCPRTRRCAARLRARRNPVRLHAALLCDVGLGRAGRADRLRPDQGNTFHRATARGRYRGAPAVRRSRRRGLARLARPAYAFRRSQLHRGAAQWRLDSDRQLRCRHAALSGGAGGPAGTSRGLWIRHRRDRACSSGTGAALRSCNFPSMRRP